MGRWSKTVMALSLAGLCGACFAAQGEAGSDHQCGAGLPAAVVEGGRAERVQACAGLAKAVAFFKALGYAPSLGGPPITYRFVSDLRLPCQDPGCQGLRVAGMYDAKARVVSVTKSSEPWMHEPGRLYFKRPYDEGMYVSVLAHESTHAINKQFYTQEPEHSAQDEYLAYASQMWGMGRALRSQVLRGYPEGEFVFKDDFSINDLGHAWDPHGFGVKSYRHFMGPKGGAKMMSRIYSGDFKPPSMEFE